MPSLAVTQPVNPRVVDLMDADSLADRQLQSAYSAAVTALAGLEALLIRNATTGAVEGYRYPLHVASGEQSTYQTKLAGTNSTVTSSGAIQLASELAVRLRALLEL